MSDLLLGEGEDEQSFDGDEAAGGVAVAEPPQPQSEQEEWPFVVERLALDSMIVDHRYQRPIEERFVAKQAADFDETLVGAIDVSYRDAGENSTYAILDGQQRYEMMKIVGKATCFAAVFQGMDLEDEAGFFFRKNKDRKAMQGYYGFRARVVAGDLAAIAVQDAVEQEDFKLGAVTDHEFVIGSISAVETAWGYSSGHRDECLTPALRTIKENWRGQEQSLQSSVLLSFASFWRKYPDDLIDAEALKAALAFISTPKNLINLGREQQTRSVTLSIAMAEVIVESYNRRRRGPVLPALRGE